MRKSDLGCLAGVAAILMGGAGSAFAAPVSWALPTTQPGITSCRQDDGLTDYPISLEAEAAGCSWTRSVTVPSWLRARLTGFRGFVLTDVYSGNWTVNALAPDGATPLGPRPVSNLAGRSDTETLDPAQVIDAAGKATLQLRGDAYAGVFMSTSRSGFQVEFDDAQAPRLENPALALPLRANGLDAVSLSDFALIENGPIISKVEVAWGDGTREELYLSGGGPWDGSEVTRFTTLLAPFPHYYTRNGLFAASLIATDGAGNTLTHPLGSVRVGPGPVATGGAAAAAKLTALRRPKVKGAARVGKRISCAQGTWRGAPARYQFTWQRLERGKWRKVGASAKTRLLRQADAGKRIRCSVKAIKGTQRMTALSVGVRVRAR